jgi:hypothetical protein
MISYDQSIERNPQYGSHFIDRMVPMAFIIATIGPIMYFDPDTLRGLLLQLSLGGS